MSNITRWHDGAFGTVDKPDWWDAEWALNWPEDGKGRDPIVTAGERHGQAVAAFQMNDNRGFIIDLDTYDRCFSIWAPTEADMLCFMIDKAQRWSSMGEDRPVSSSLADLRNAVISIARWGIDSRSIGAFDGFHDRDRK